MRHEPSSTGTHPAAEASGHPPETPRPASLLQRLEDGLVGVLAILALSVCMVNVFLRNFSSGASIAASDEIQVYLVVWAVFLSLGVITANDRHVKADIFVSMFSPRARDWIALFSDALGLAFCALMIYLGLSITMETYDFGDVSSTSLRFPMWIYTAALPAGAALMAVRYAARLSRGVKQVTGGLS